VHANKTAAKEQKLNEPKSEHGEDQSKHEKAKNGNARAEHEKMAKPQPTKANLAHSKPSHVRCEGDQALGGAWT